MTLITNEIHVLDGFRKTVLVFAADQRIVKPDGKFTNGRKLFRIPYLEAGVSYFGLAEVFPGGRRSYMSQWLPGFITRQAGVPTLRDFVFRLRDELNKIVPPRILANNASGFHTSGYNSDSLPEFWYFSNIGGMDTFAYKNLQPSYGEPTSDFLGRDAKALGWNGTDLTSIRNEGIIYRNGDIRGHVVAFERLDKVLIDMLSFPDFKKPQPEDWVRFKFEVVAHFYKKFARRAIIGTPIDVFSIAKDDTLASF